MRFHPASARPTPFIDEDRGETTVTATPGVGDVKVPPEALRKLAGTTEDMAARIAKTFSERINDAEALCQQDLKGALGNAFRGKSYHLNHGVQDAMRALDEIAGKLSNAERRFGLADDESAQLLQQAAQNVEAGHAPGNVDVRDILTGVKP